MRQRWLQKREAGSGNFPGQQSWQPQRPISMEFQTLDRAQKSEETNAAHVEESPVKSSEEFFDGVSPITLGIVCACGLLAMIIVLGMLVWIRARRKRQKLLHDLTFDDGLDPSKRIKSAPTSKSPSPKQDKRLSWTEPPPAKHLTRGMLVRSLTADRIPEFTLPPERVQPRSQSLEGEVKRENTQQFTYTSPQHGYVISNESESYCTQRTTSEEDDQASPEGGHGRLWYSVLYNPDVEELAVTLVKVKDLPGREPNNSPRDPFVKMFVLPDERNIRVSKVKRKTLNPVYNETVSFIVPRSEVAKRVLRFSVYDVDKRRVRHSLGHVLVNLKNIDLGKGDTRWADLEAAVQPVSVMGDVQVSLLYQPHNDKIKVGLHKARNVSCIGEFPTSMGAYIRIQLFYGHKCHRVKRTLAVTPAADMSFNESLSFTVQGRQFDSCNIAISLMLTFPGVSKPAVVRTPGTHSAEAASVLGDTDKEYGRVVLGPFMYAHGEELAHWQEMLGHPKAVSTKWHALSNMHGQHLSSP